MGLMNLKDFLASLKIPTDRGLFLVYGKAGVGKTTFLMEFSKANSGKALIVDSENGFNVDRFKQICVDTSLDNLIIARPKSFEEQTKIISNTLDNEKLFDFIGVDTIGRHYREAVKMDKTKSNYEIAMQMRILKEISRKKPVVVCNQVYQNITENKVEPVGRSYVTKWCDYVIHLDEENQVRTLKINNIVKEFKLTEKGFEFI